MVYEEWRDESEEKERDGRGGEKSLRKSEEASEQGGGWGNNSFLISFLLFQKEKYKAFAHNFFERTRVREKY